MANDIANDKAAATREQNRLRAARWRAENPEKAREQRRRFRARLRGEDIPYVKPNTTPIEAQREAHKIRMKEWHQKRKARMAADPEYKERINSVRREYSKRKYRINRGLDPITGDQNKPRSHKALSPEEKARRAAVREYEKAARKAAREAEKALAKAIRREERVAREKERAREKAIAKLAAERAKRAAEVERAKAKQIAAENKSIPQFKPPPKLGRFAAMAKWYRF